MKMQQVGYLGPGICFVSHFPSLQEEFLEDLQMQTGYLAVGQNQWYHFGIGAPPILVGIGMFTGGTGL